MKQDVYFFRGMSSLKFQPDLHDLDELIRNGWKEYDPLAPAGPECFRTLLTHKGPPCKHVTRWWCPQAVSAMTEKYGRGWRRGDAEAEAFPPGTKA